MRGTGIFATFPILTTVFEFNKTVFVSRVLKKTLTEPEGRRLRKKTK